MLGGGCHPNTLASAAAHIDPNLSAVVRTRKASTNILKLTEKMVGLFSTLCLWMTLLDICHVVCEENDDDAEIELENLEFFQEEELEKVET